MKFCYPYALAAQEFRLFQHFVLSPNPHESQKLKSSIPSGCQEGPYHGPFVKLFKRGRKGKATVLGSPTLLDYYDVTTT